MFERIVTNLNAVRRLDVVAHHRDLNWGKITEETSRGPRDVLAVEVRGREMTFEPAALRQIGERHTIPGEHFERLPLPLAVAELEHFRAGISSRNSGLTLRAIDAEKGPARARAALSGIYTPFDNAEVLEVAAPILEPLGYEVGAGLDHVDRDRMALAVLNRKEFDVADPKSRKVGDIVQVGIRLLNSEVGDGSTITEFIAKRLICTNGMARAVPEVTAHLRHVHHSRDQFRVMLETSIRMASKMGEVMARQLVASHAIRLDRLDRTESPEQERIHSVLRRARLDTKKFEDAANRALGTKEEPSLFGLIQFVSGDFTREVTDLGEQMRRQRVAGDLMSLAA